MKVPITKGARQFGYIIWTKRTNSKFQEMFKDLESVDVYLNGLFLGNKKIDWKYHRISLGYKFTRALPLRTKYFLLNLEDNNTLKVECE